MESLSLNHLNRIYERTEEIENFLQKMLDIIRDDGDIGSVARMQRQALDSVVRLQLNLKDFLLDIKAAESVDKSTGEAAEFFERHASSHQNSARRWFVAMVALALITVVYAILFLCSALIDFPHIDPNNQFQFVRISAASLLFITFLFTATLWVSRMYKANLHLQTINNHRATSISVVNTLRAGSLTDGAKDTIVTEAARAIFSDPQTGLIIDKSSDNSTSFNIRDLVKTGN